MDLQRVSRIRNQASLARAIGMAVTIGLFLPAGFAFATTSGPNHASAITGNTGAGSQSWTIPANSLDSLDSNYATISLDQSQVTHYLSATNFGFSIPPGSTINGIQISVRRVENGSSDRISDNSVRLVKGGVIGGDDKANTSTTWGQTETTVNYGSSSDLWGQSWTADDINASNFGIVFSAKHDNSANHQRVASVNFIQITISYTLPATGTLHVTKVTVPANDTTAFSITTSGSGTITAPASRSTFATNHPEDFTVTAGTYSVAETAKAGWIEDVSACQSKAVSAGQTINCTITNTKRGSLTIIKHVVNDNGGSKTAANFTMSVTGTNVSNASFAGSESGVTVTLDPGAYSIDESTVTGYSKTLGASCTGTMTAGGSATCTITNDDIAPTLTVVKHVVTDNGGTAVAGDWTMDVTGTNVSQTGFSGSESGTTITLDAGAAYSVSESGGFSGYAETLGADCSGTLLPGDQKTCTITNDDIPPTIQIKKITTGGGSGTFHFTVVGPDPSTATALSPADTTVVTSGDSSGGAGETEMLALNLTGTYMVNEVAQTSWDPGSASCELKDSLNPDIIISSADSAHFTADLGESWVCTFSNTKRGSITVHKTLLTPGDGNTNANGDPAEFTVRVTNGNDVNLSQTVAGGNDVTFNNLKPGDYTVSEDDPSPQYSLDGISPDSDSVAAGAQVTVFAGQPTSVTVTNRQHTSTLRVIKHVVSSLGDKTAADFQLSVTGSNVSPASFAGSEDGTTVTLDPGAYVVGETAVDGYALSASKGCDNTIASGEDATCTLTNSDVPEGKIAITVFKHVNNDNGGTAESSDFDPALQVTRTDGESPVPVEGVASGVANILDPGTYTIDEGAGGPAGYTKTTTACTDNGSAMSGTTIEGVAGHAYICTITNDDDAPSLTLVKTVDNGNGVGTTTKDAFTLTATGPTTISGAGGAASDSSFKAGTYTLSETSVDGYTAGSWSCTGVENNGDHITLGLGQSTTCTIINTAQPGTLHIVKHVTNDHGGTKVASDFTYQLVHGEATGDPAHFTADENTLNGHADLTLSAGQYSVTEPSVDGYATSYDTCSDVFIKNGGEATCTITNSDVAPPIISAQTTAHASETSLTVTWTTDHPATSRVIYDTVSHTSLGEAPNYGYTNSTTEDSALVTDHSVVVPGLSSGTTYFLRTISHGSPEAVSDEFSGTTSSGTPTELPPPPPVVQTGNGAPVGLIGGFGGQVLGASTGPTTGQVLGASTSTPTSCTALLATFMRRSTVNNPTEVKKLQQFLNTEMGSGLPVTGFFGVLTENAVKAFQKKYAADVLAPWRLTAPTGVVGTLTKWKINMQSCPSLHLSRPTI